MLSDRCLCCLSVLSVVCLSRWCGQTVGWDQDETWYAGRARPRPHCVRWESSSSSKGAQPLPNFRPTSVLDKRPDAYQDATWYGGRPLPRQHCFRWQPSSPKKGHSPQFSAHVRCGQTAGWIKMPLGMGIGLGPGDLVLDGDPQKGHSPSANFWPMSIAAKRLAQPPIFDPCPCDQTARCIKMQLGMEVGLGPGDFVLDGDPALPSPKRGRSTPKFSVHVLIVSKRLDGSRWYLAWRLASAQATLY